MSPVLGLKDIRYWLGLAAFVLIGYHVYLLFNYNYYWTDSDQTIQWIAAQEFSQGIFRQPRFYGQSYGVMLEALIASPLVMLGVKPQFALPIATHLLFLGTVFNLFTFFWRKKSRRFSVGILLIIISLPMYFDIMTSLPRAFIPGIWLSSLTLLRREVSDNFFQNLLTGLLIALGLSMNVSAIFLAGPIVVYYFFESSSKIRFTIGLGSGVIVGVLIHTLAAIYYILHPETVIHDFRLVLSTYDLGLSVTLLSETFKGFLPGPLGYTGWSVVVLLAIGLITAFFRLMKPESILIFTLIGLVFLSLTTNKSHDGYNSVYFSTSRMYLSMPFVFIFIIGLHLKRDISPLVLILIGSASLSFFVVKVSSGFEHFHLNGKRMVQVVEVDRLNEICADLKETCDETNTSLVLVGRLAGSAYINYGCSSIMESGIIIMEPKEDRRVWVWQANENRIFDKFIFVSSEPELPEPPDNATIAQLSPVFYLVEGKARSIKLWVRELGIKTPH